jgi:transcriptional regulator with XRE-family HTH domain
MHSPDSILRELGARARALRVHRGWTLREFAERSGVSARFLVQLESGRGNISVRRLVDVARALDTTPAALLSEAPTARKLAIALLGLRGAGKTTVGRRVARRLGVPFVELDRRIEQAAELSLSEIFSLHGEQYYRRVERETLDVVLAEARPGHVPRNPGDAPTSRHHRLAPGRSGRSLESCRPSGRSPSDGQSPASDGRSACAAGGARAALCRRRSHHPDVGRICREGRGSRLPCRIRRLNVSSPFRLASARARRRHGASGASRAAAAFR